MQLDADWRNIKSIISKRKASFTWRRLMLTSIIVNICTKLLMRYQLKIMDKVMEM